jgi:hypothetical protein
LLFLLIYFFFFRFLIDGNQTGVILAYLVFNIFQFSRLFLYSLLKNVTPASSVAVGDLAAGASVSQTWNVRGDNEGSGTVTGSALSGGTTLDTKSQSLTVIK